MEEFIFRFLTEHSALWSTIGQIVVFFGSLFESTPFLGILAPTQTILIVAGFFTHTSSLGFLHIFLLAILGSIIGDVLSFWLGKRFGTELLSKYGHKFLIKKEYIVKTQELIDTHLGKTLFIGRLNSIPRSLGPFIAGSSKVTFLRFFFWASLGAVLWSFTFVSIGFVFGHSFEIIGPAVGKFILSAVIIILASLAILLYIRKKHFYITSHHISVMLIFIVSLFSLSLITQSVVEHAVIKETDMIIHSTLSNLNTPSLTNIMLVVTKFGDKIPLTLISICIAFLLFIKKEKKWAIFFLWNMAVGAIGVYLFKTIVANPRPTGGLLIESGFSFPSGHATLSSIFAITLAYTYIKRGSKEIIKTLAILFAILFPLTIAFSRVYLGVHWLSDVLAGFLFALTVISFSILLFDFTPWLYKKIRTRQIVPNI